MNWQKVARWKRFFEQLHSFGLYIIDFDWHPWLMKSMKCNQLGGACDLLFSGETFDELASQSQQHGKEMFGANDADHMAAMSAMMELMKSGEMDSWMAARKAEFDAL